MVCDVQLALLGTCKSKSPREKSRDASYVWYDWRSEGAQCYVWKSVHLIRTQTATKDEDSHGEHDNEELSWAPHCTPHNKGGEDRFSNESLPSPPRPLLSLTVQKRTRIWSPWSHCSRMLRTVIVRTESQPSSSTTTKIEEEWTIWKVTGIYSCKRVISSTCLHKMPMMVLLKYNHQLIRIVSPHFGPGRKARLQ